MQLVSDGGTTFNAMLNPSQITQIQERIQRDVKQLCQNCIVFGVQLTIQGYLSITVDGSKVLLVNIQEQVDKTKDDESLSSSAFISTRTMTAEIQMSPVDVSKKKTKAQRHKSDSSVALVEIEDESTGDCVVLEDDETSKRTGAFHLNTSVANRGKIAALLLADFGDDCEADKDENHSEAENDEQEYDESTTSAETFITRDQLHQTMSTLINVNVDNEQPRITPSTSSSSTTNLVTSDESTGDCVVIEDEQSSKRTQAFNFDPSVATTGETITLLLSDSDDDCEADKDKNHFAVNNEEHKYDESTTSTEAFVACDKLFQEAVNVNNELSQITPSTSSSTTTNSVRSITKQNKEADPLNYTAAPQRLQKYGPNNSAYDASNVNEHQNGYVCWNYMDNPEAWKTSSLSWGTSHQVFKCLTCGQVMRHLSSFLRHKKQHQGLSMLCLRQGDEPQR